MKKGFFNSKPVAETAEPSASAGPSAPTPAAPAATPRIFSREELQLYDGHDLVKPLLLSIKGVVLDVSAGADFYGLGQSYNVFTGIDGSKGFALMSLNAKDAHDDLSGLDAEELGILDDWYTKLCAKYPQVGVLAGTSAASSRALPERVAAASAMAADSSAAAPDTSDGTKGDGGESICVEECHISSTQGAPADDLYEWRTVGADCD
jgi:predicted heme/steroid binding protein